MNIYDFKVKKADGSDLAMSDYQGKVLLIVNTASKCGFTPQYDELEMIYQLYKDRGLMVLGFPCNQFGGQEAGSDEEIQEFCKVNHGVTFPVLAKIDVNGDNADPVFKFLKENSGGFITNAIKWNFTKFLVDKNGNVRERYGSMTKPVDMKQDIETLLNE